MATTPNLRAVHPKYLYLQLRSWWTDCHTYLALIFKCPVSDKIMDSIQLTSDIILLKYKHIH